MAKRGEGKWERFAESLPRMPAGLDAERRGNKEYLERVELKKSEYSGKGTAGLVEDYRLARAEKDEVEAELKPINLRVTALTQLVDERFKAEGLRSLKMDDGASVGCHDEPYASLPPEAKGEFLRWVLIDALRNVDLQALIDARAADAVEAKVDPAMHVKEGIAEAMIKDGLVAALSLPWQTLNSMCKDALEEGREPPPGVKLFMLAKVSLRGAKGNNGQEGGEE